MANKPSLDEIFTGQASSQPAAEKPSLDQIFSSSTPPEDNSWSYDKAVAQSNQLAQQKDESLQNLVTTPSAWGGIPTGAFDATVGNVVNLGLKFGTEIANYLNGTDLKSPQLPKTTDTARQLTGSDPASQQAFDSAKFVGEVLPGTALGGTGAVAYGTVLGAGQALDQGGNVLDILGSGAKTGLMSGVAYAGASKLMDKLETVGQTKAPPMTQLDKSNNAVEALSKSAGDYSPSVNRDVQQNAKNFVRDSMSSKKAEANLTAEKVFSKPINIDEITNIPKPQGQAASELIALAEKEALRVLPKNPTPEQLSSFKYADTYRRVVRDTINDIRNSTLKEDIAAKNSLTELDDYYQQLTGKLDELNPDYQPFRVITGDNIQDAHYLEKTQLGKLARDVGKLENFGKNIFNASDNEFNMSVDWLRKTNPEGLRQITAKHLDDVAQAKPFDKSAVEPLDFLKTLTAKDPELSKLSYALGDDKLTSLKFKALAKIWQQIDPNNTFNGGKLADAPLTGTIIKQYKNLIGKDAKGFNKSAVDFATNKAKDAEFKEIISTYGDTPMGVYKITQLIKEGSVKNTVKNSFRAPMIKMDDDILRQPKASPLPGVASIFTSNYLNSEKQR